MAEWITPVLDWDSSKFYNVEDLNRVENNTAVVADLISHFDTVPPIVTIANRTMKRIEFADSLTRIESNQDVLRQRYTPDGWMHRVAESDAPRVPQKVDGTFGDVRLDEVDLWENRNLINPLTTSGWSNGYRKVGNTYSLKGLMAGIRIVKETFEPFTTYTISFKIRKTSGSLYTLAGHSSLKNSSVFRDGVRIGSSWTNGAPYPNDNDVHSYVIIGTSGALSGADDALYIQPNRNTYADDYTADIWDLQMIKGDTLAPWQPAPEDNIPWYHTTKTANLAPINLSSLDQYESSLFEWETDTPEGTGIIVEWSLDNQTWTPIQSGQSLPFRQGDWLTGKMLYLRQCLYTNDQTKTPALRNFSYSVQGYQTKIEWQSNAPFDYTDAARYENNLALLYFYYSGNLNARPYCGMVSCGEEVI